MMVELEHFQEIDQVAGGGGAGGSGTDGGGNAGPGGVGVQCLIAGNPSPIGTPGPSGDGWFAGGGGGGGYNVNAGSGGAGGGGAGRSSPTAGVPGTANTGGGGGGGFHPGATTGGNGGSGIVVIDINLLDKYPKDCYNPKYLKQTQLR